MAAGTGDTVKGKAQEALGKGKEVLGNALGNEQLADEGRADQAKGTLNRAKGAIRETLADVGDTLHHLSEQDDDKHSPA